MSKASGASAAAVLVTAIAAALLLQRFAPAPAADVGRGSEEPFASGLHRRELPPRQPPQRWTGPEASFRFDDVPGGPARLEVHVRGQRAPVAVAVDGVVVGIVPLGEASGSFAVPPRPAGSREVRLVTTGFVAADGRLLGVLLDRVRLVHPLRALPSPRLLAIVLLPALAVLAAGRTAGAGPLAAGGLGAGIAVLAAALLWPYGLVRSGYAPTLAALLVAVAVSAALFARLAGRVAGGSGPWAFSALMAAGVVQGVLATSPLMVVSDAVFHANKLAQVAGGDLFPTSFTQHARPFRFPYGISFYAPLVPLARAGLDEVAVVRGAAALAGAAASAILFLLLAPTGARRAGLSAVLLQLLPGVFDVYSYGNLSNVFGQSLTVAFFAWWAGRAVGGAAVGALLLAGGALAHLSSFVVLGALAACLAAAGWKERRPDRRRLLALALGLLASGAYYASFAPLIAEQVPRILEGGGRGFESSTGLAASVRRQVASAVGQWGLPALILAVAGRPRPGASRLDRDLAAFWAAGGLLVLPALLTPLDVRYLYALTVPLAVAAATGAGALPAWGRGGSWLAGGLLALQALLAARGVIEALLWRYRS